MDLKKWFENQNIEPVQDRKDMMDCWKNYELFTYNDLMECLEALSELNSSSLLLKEREIPTFPEYLLFNEYAIIDKMHCIKNDVYYLIPEIEIKYKEDFNL